MSWRDVLTTAFDTPVEVHAFVHGLFRGLYHLRPRAAAQDAREELHYFRGGLVLGYLTKLLAALVALALVV